MGATITNKAASGAGGGDVFLAATQEFTGVNTFDLAPILGVDGTYGGALKFRDLGGSGFTGIIAAPNLFTGNVSLTMPQASGTWMVTGNDTHSVVGNGAVADAAAGKIGAFEITGRSNAVAITKLTNTTPAGVYLISTQIACTTTGAGLLQITYSATTDGGARTISPISRDMTVAGISSAATPIYLASGNITFVTAFLSSGSGTYAVRIRGSYQG